MFNFKVFQELAFYSHTTFKAHLLGRLGQHIFGISLNPAIVLNFPQF